MIEVDCPQNSEEWFTLKAGVPSASNFNKIITPGGDISKQRTKYLYQLAGEKITGRKEETYQSRAMAEGIVREGEARNLYELINDVDVRQTGVCYKDDRKSFLCSPDGLINNNALLEIKCPLIHTHVSYLLEKKVPSDYFCQVQGQLYVTEREACDFMSYYPGMAPLIIETPRDEEFISKLEKALEEFAVDLGDLIKQITENNG